MKGARAYCPRRDDNRKMFGIPGPIITTTLLFVLALRALRGKIVLLWFFSLPGTMLHELLHWITALLLGGRPGGIDLIPHRAGPGYWVMGSVVVNRPT